MELRKCTSCKTTYTEDEAIINPMWDEVLKTHENFDCCPKCLNPEYTIVT